MFGFISLLVDSVGIKGADLEDKFVFCGFPNCLDARKGAADRHLLFRMVREIKVSSDWFGCIQMSIRYI